MSVTCYLRYISSTLLSIFLFIVFKLFQFVSYIHRAMPHRFLLISVYNDNINSLTYPFGYIFLYRILIKRRCQVLHPDVFSTSSLFYLHYTALVCG